MILKRLSLQNFRSHKKQNFSFDKTTIIIGKNTAGKTNIIEAINFLSSGKSFRAEKEFDTIFTDELFAKVVGIIEEEKNEIILTVILSHPPAGGQGTYFSKKFLVNDVPRRQIDFVSNFYSVLFTPQDLDIISNSPSIRRKYIDSILYKALRHYRVALLTYEKALRNRNKMLDDMHDGKKNYSDKDFDYWNKILIENGKILTDEREQLVEYLNKSEKEMFEFTVFYDRSTITEDRLNKYYEAERASGVTLVGPQRDEFVFLKKDGTTVKEFGSRGEQRLTILQTKILEVRFLKERTNREPVLLLDDIFSELDESNINKVFELLPNQQTIITTTHKEFVPEKLSKKLNFQTIELT